MNRKRFSMFFGVTLLFLLLAPMGADAVGIRQARVKPGTEPATCEILSPADGATVSDVVTITVSATGAPTVYIDGVRLGKDYSLDWDSTTVGDGVHVIEAVYKEAVDTITVTVDNGGTPPPPPGGDGVVRKWALCIGISDYEGTANDLTYCDEDAQDWINYLRGEGYTIISLFDNQATYDNIISALQQIAANEDGDDMVAVTYSGHGSYDRGIRQSGWVSHDLYLVAENDIESITDTFDSTSVFWFNDCCNIGTLDNLANAGWVMGQGSNTRTYTYDGDASMDNGIYTYFAMEAIAQGYFTAEDICAYAAQMFNAATPGKAYTVDNYTGDLDI